MSGGQQWSSELYSGSRQQQGFSRSAQAPTSFTHSVNGSSQNQQMIQPLSVNPSFNSHSVNASPFYPNMHFQAYQRQLMSSQGIRPFQLNAPPAAPSSSQSAAQGDHRVLVPFGYTPVPAVQAQGAHVDRGNRVYLYPSPYQPTQVDSGQPQRYQMLLQNGQIGNNQTIPTQTSQFFSGHLTSQRTGSAKGAQRGVQAALFGEAQGNRPLSASNYQGVQNKASCKEPSDNEATLKSQNGALQ